MLLELDTEKAIFRVVERLQAKNCHVNRGSKQLDVVALNCSGFNNYKKLLAVDK